MAGIGTLTPTPVRPELVEACPERLLQAASRRGPLFFGWLREPRRTRTVLRQAQHGRIIVRRDERGLSGIDPLADIDFAVDCAEVFTMRNLHNKMLAPIPHNHYDQSIRLGWKVSPPVSLLFVVLVSGYFMATRYGV